MKKVFGVFLILTLSWSEVSGQGHPIKPYRETDYSILEVKQFAMEETNLSCNWRREFLKIINEGLYASGENMIVNESNMYWIFNQITYERRNLINFTNSMRNNNEINFFPDKSFDGMVAVFQYNQCSLVVYKTRCMNLLKVQQQTVVREQYSPTVNPVVCDRPVRHYLDEWQPIVEKQVVLPCPVVKEKKCCWFVKALVYFVGASAIATGTYLLCNRDREYHREGNPGGAPITPPVVPTVPDNGGGPGGAPTTP